MPPRHLTQHILGLLLLSSRALINLANPPGRRWSYCPLRLSATQGSEAWIWSGHLQSLQETTAVSGAPCQPLLARLPVAWELHGGMEAHFWLCPSVMSQNQGPRVVGEFWYPVH